MENPDDGESPTALLFICRPGKSPWGCHLSRLAQLELVSAPQAWCPVKGATETLKVTQFSAFYILCPKSRFPLKGRDEFILKHSSQKENSVTRHQNFKRLWIAHPKPPAPMQAWVFSQLSKDHFYLFEGYVLHHQALQTGHSSFLWLFLKGYIFL